MGRPRSAAPRSRSYHLRLDEATGRRVEARALETKQSAVELIRALVELAFEEELPPDFEDEALEESSPALLVEPDGFVRLPRTVLDGHEDEGPQAMRDAARRAFVEAEALAEDREAAAGPRVDVVAVNGEEGALRALFDGAAGGK